MAEQPPTSPPTVAQVQASLHQLAQVLRDAGHLEPEAQDALADLVDELGKLLDPSTVPSAAAAHLASSAANLARGLHQRQNPTLLAAAKQRLVEAAVRAENEAPMAAGIVQRFLDTLANLGI